MRAESSSVVFLLLVTPRPHIILCILSHCVNTRGPVSTTNGFSKLNEEYKRSSVFHITPPAEGYGLQGGTRINLGFGRCLKLRVKAERDEGSLRIGGLALAANCNHIVLIFGFFFLLAGAVLTTLAYKTKPRETSESLDVGPREDGKIAGPLFVVIGSTLIIVGMGLTLVGWKVNQEAKRQRNHFTLQTPPPPTPDSQDYFGSGFANIHDSNFLSRVTTPSTLSSRRESFFSGSVFSDRRRTLPTIAQAVPIGFFVDGRLSGVPEGASISSRQPTSPGSSDRVGNLKQMETDGNMDSNETNVHRKASLSLRPSLPIPIIASPSFIRSRMIAPLDPNCLVRTRSDEPFGSIVSLSGTGDIACFPAAPTLFAPCLEEELPSLEIPENSASRTITAVQEATTSSASTIDIDCRKLPDIQVNNELPTFVSN